MKSQSVHLCKCADTYFPGSMVDTKTENWSMQQAVKKKQAKVPISSSNINVN